MERITPALSVEHNSVDIAAANHEVVSLFSRELVSVKSKLREAEKRAESAEALAVRRASEIDDLEERIENLNAENRRLRSGGVKKEEPGDDNTELLRDRSSVALPEHTALLQNFEEATNRIMALEQELRYINEQNDKLQRSKSEKAEKYKDLKQKSKTIQMELQGELETTQEAVAQLEKKHQEFITGQQKNAPFSVMEFMKTGSEVPRRYLKHLKPLSRQDHFSIPNELKNLLASPKSVLQLSDAQALWRNGPAGNILGRALVVIPPSCLDTGFNNGLGRWSPFKSLPKFRDGVEYDLFVQLTRGWVYPGVFRCIGVHSCSFDELFRSMEDQKKKCVRVRDNVIEKTFLQPSLVPPAIRNVVSELYKQGLLHPTIVTLEEVPDKNDLALALATYQEEEKSSQQSKQQGKRKRTNSGDRPPVVKRAKKDT